MSTPTILFFLGAPGSGKTTLARQAHAALAPQFGDQTCFCEMSDLVDAVENAGDDLGKLIKEHLKERKPIPPSVLVDIVWAGMQLPAPPPTALQTVQPLLSTTNEQPTEGASGSVHLPPQTEAGMSTSNTDYTVQQTSAEALQPQPETVSTTSTAQHTQADCAASLRTSVNAEGTSGSMQLPPQTAASGTSGADTLEQPSTQSVQDRMGATPTQDISAAALEPPAKGQSSSTQLGGEPGSGPKAAEPDAGPTPNEQQQPPTNISGAVTQNKNETQQQQAPTPQLIVCSAAEPDASGGPTQNEQQQPLAPSPTNISGGVTQNNNETQQQQPPTPQLIVCSGFPRNTEQWEELMERLNNSANNSQMDQPRILVFNLHCKKKIALERMRKRKRPNENSKQRVEKYFGWTFPNYIRPLLDTLKQDQEDQRNGEDVTLVEVFSEKDVSLLVEEVKQAVLPVSKPADVAEECAANEEPAAKRQKTTQAQ